MTTPDMFGGKPDKALSPHYIKPRGYASPPGTGPEGETCATCKHARRYGRYSKCGHPIRRHFNTHGPATDILLGTSACSKWERNL